MSDFVEFRHLEYIVALDERKNFSKAADSVFRSQPVISQQIKQLEENYGFPIFKRRGRNGVSRTVPGVLIVRWAKKTLKERHEIFGIARAIWEGKVPTLRLGFSPFVNPLLLHAFRGCYDELFPGCEVQLSSGDTTHTLQRLEQGNLDCAVLPLPVDRDLWNVMQVAQSPLVVCMRADDPLASQAQVDLREIADRINIFRDPELHPAAHSRLREMFSEAGISLHMANSAATPADMQWMVKEKCGLALIDQLSVLDSGLVTRPIAGVQWTADTAFVTAKESKHMALPFVENYLRESGLNPRRKPPQSEDGSTPHWKMAG